MERKSFDWVCYVVIPESWLRKGSKCTPFGQAGGWVSEDKSVRCVGSIFNIDKDIQTLTCWSTEADSWEELGDCGSRTAGVTTGSWGGAAAVEELCDNFVVSRRGGGCCCCGSDWWWCWCWELVVVDGTGDLAAALLGLSHPPPTTPLLLFTVAIK